MRHQTANPIKPSFFSSRFFLTSLMEFAAQNRTLKVKAVERLPQTDNFLTKEKNYVEQQSEFHETEWPARENEHQGGPRPLRRKS
jgi:hypothetical protein